MSLRAKAIWRASISTPRLVGLSSISRWQLNLPPPWCRQYDRRMSSRVPTRRKRTVVLPSRVPKPRKRTAVLQSADPAPRLPHKLKLGHQGVKSERKPTMWLSSTVQRSMLRRIIWQQAAMGENASVLVRPLAQHSNNFETKRTRRKHMRSRARQIVFAYGRGASGQAEPSWSSTLDLLARSTPHFGDLFEFKVIVGKGVASAGQAILLGLDTNLWQIRQRTQCVVRVETDPMTGNLHLSLTGFERSVRRALIEVVNTVGKVTAIRVLDQDSEDILLDLLQEKKSGKWAAIKLLGEGEQQPDEKILTVNRERQPAQALLVDPGQRSETYKYKLRYRADEIPRPSEWTEASFMNYVIALVWGRIPSHMTRTLYMDGPDHQQTVISLLVGLFCSESARPGQSGAALKMALSYIQSKGLGFRAAARTIFTQAEVHNIPIDTQTCNLFLTNCSKLRDVAGFEAILKLMIRKHCVPDSETWLAFLQLVEDPKVKQRVLREMRSRGLNRMQSTLVKVGSHMVTHEVDPNMTKAHQLQYFISLRDKLYSAGWLDIMALNQLLNVLGERRLWDLCDEVLSFAFTTGRVTPDTITLDTMITHYRNVSRTVALMRSMRLRWPQISPDTVTYSLLFQQAWRNRNPNMLRVILRYSSFDKHVSPVSLKRLSVFLFKQTDLGRLSYLKPWEDVILGEEAMAEINKRGAKYHDAAKFARWYGKQAMTQQLAVPFEEKLAEAHETDMQIHLRTRQGEVMTESVRKSLTVELPTKPRRSTADANKA